MAALSLHSRRSSRTVSEAELIRWTRTTLCMTTAASSSSLSRWSTSHLQTSKTSTTRRVSSTISHLTIQILICTSSRRTTMWLRSKVEQQTMQWLTVNHSRYLIMLRRMMNWRGDCWMSIRSYVQTRRVLMNKLERNINLCSRCSSCSNNSSTLTANKMRDQVLAIRKCSHLLANTFPVK
jgi:hypothetical protein